MVQVILSERSLASNHQARLKRAYIALQGLGVGDALGDQFFMKEDDAVEAIENRKILQGEWHFTDDTLMAASIYDVLAQHKQIDQNALARSFAKHLDKSRGYGAGALSMLVEIQNGGDWYTLSHSRYGGMGSAGNGSAMRVAPLGAYFADDIPLLIKQARLSSEVTHANEEAIVGAIIVAIAAALAWKLRESKPNSKSFISQVLDYAPVSIVREKLRHAYNLDESASVQLAVSALGNGNALSAIDTVPFAIWCASRHLDNFEEAIWTTLRGLGDRDTNCAIVGGIVANSVGVDAIPTIWKSSCEVLPEWINQ